MFVDNFHQRLGDPSSCITRPIGHPERSERICFSRRSLVEREIPLFARNDHDGVGGWAPGALLNPADSFMRLLRTRGRGTDAMLLNRIQNAIGKKTFRQPFDLNGYSLTREENDLIGLVTECRFRPRNPVDHQ